MRAETAERKLNGLTLSVHKFYVASGDPAAEFTDDRAGLLLPATNEDWAAGAPDWWSRVNARFCKGSYRIQDVTNVLADGGTFKKHYYVRACVDVPE